MERNSEEKSDKYRVNLGVWQPKFGRSFAIWQFGRTFGFPKDENSDKQRKGLCYRGRGVARLEEKNRTVVRRRNGTRTSHFR